MLVNLYQKFYFLCDRNNLVTQSFVNEINTFLPIYCSASIFGEKITKRIALLSAAKTKSFFVAKNWEKEQLNLQIAKICGEKADTADKKKSEVFISRISKKRTRKMEVENFVIICGKQGFEADKALNPAEIKIENDGIQNMFIKHQKKHIQICNRSPALL